MNYEITIDNFKGPLDLLIHLVKESKVDIMDINIFDISNQYLDYINQMEKLNLNIASEYLVMASELLEIKSRMLLPKKIEEKEGEDPELELKMKLVEYEKYKKLTDVFKNLEISRKKVYTKLPHNLDEYRSEIKIEEGFFSPDDLLKALNSFLERKKEEKPLNTKIARKELSVEKRIFEIKAILAKNKKIDFFDLFDIVTNEYIVVTFLAILEMAKQQELLIKQENNFKKIFCEVV